MPNKSEINFTIGDAQRAADDWGFNCGPGAICAILCMTPDELRPHMGDFESKHYTNPTLMLDVLNRLKAEYRMVYRADEPHRMLALAHGLMRVQWAGSWTNPGVPIRARYRQTHWVGVRNGGREVFDVNAMCVGGWLPYEEWATQLIPWLLKEAVPKASGAWWPTHGIEITVANAQSCGAPERQREASPPVDG